MKYPKIYVPLKKDGDYFIEPYAYAKDEFAYLSKNYWAFYEKIDGTNISINYEFGNLTFKSREQTDIIPYTINEYLSDKIKLYTIRDMFFGKTIYIYGEGCTKGVRSSQRYVKNGEIANFIVFDINIDGWWLNPIDIMDICESLKLDYVPFYEMCHLNDVYPIVKTGFNSQYGDFLAEGLIGKPIAPVHFRNGERIITKIRHKDFKK